MWESREVARLNERGRWYHPDLPGKDFANRGDCEDALAKKNGQARADEEALWNLDPEGGDDYPRLKQRANAQLERQNEAERKRELAKLVGAQMGRWDWWIDNPRNANLVRGKIEEFMAQTGRNHWSADVDLPRAIDVLVESGELPVGPTYKRLTPSDRECTQEQLYELSRGQNPFEGSTL